MFLNFCFSQEILSGPKGWLIVVTHTKAFSVLRFLFVCLFFNSIELLDF